MSQRFSVASLCLVALAAAAVPMTGAAGGASDDPGAFVLGVLRRDGVLTPFAAFDGRRWRKAWPDTVSGIELPISLNDVPKGWWGLETRPETFGIWDGGKRTGDVTITGVTTSRPMCQPRIALRTDYKASEVPPPPMERPYPKDGLAVAGAASVTAIERITDGAALDDSFRRRLLEEFNRQEQRAVRSYYDWQHPVPERLRNNARINIEALYRAPMDEAGWTAHFVEAVRQYAPGPSDADSQCPVVTYLTGWVLRGPKDRWHVEMNAKVMYCDRYRAGYMLPFGLVTARQKTYWVFQYSGFDSEWYEVARPTRDGIEAEIGFRGGSCEPER